MSSGRSRVHVGQAGFTLVEVLIATAVMGIILPAVVGTFIVSLKTTDETNQRFLDSHDVQSAAAFVNADVENATGVSTTDTTSCIASAYPADHAALLLSWTDRSTEGSALSHQVNYYVSGTALIRSQCVGGGQPSALAIVQNLDPSTAPDVLCQPADCTASIALRGTTVSGQPFSLIGTRRTSP